MAKKPAKAKLNYSKDERKTLIGNARREAKRNFCDCCNAKTRSQCICRVEDEIHPFSDDAFSFEGF
jgi:hypothetical protein